MGKIKKYLVLDTETASLPFVSHSDFTEKQKHQIALTKPLIYDIGWVLIDRKGNIYDKQNYLINETFFNANIFNTAYYVDRRSIYLEKIKSKEIQCAPWGDVKAQICKALESADLVTGYNACFDFKKALPFTLQYMENLYSNNFNDWLKKQYGICKHIETSNYKNPDFLNTHCEFCGVEYILFDLWDVTCKRLINIDKYRKYCLSTQQITNSKEFFKTSAETAFQYLLNQYDFKEEHTALSDSIIESQLLVKALKKGKINPTDELGSFPFRVLGTTVDFCLEKGKKYIPFLFNEYKQYYDNLQENCCPSYLSRVYANLSNLYNAL